MRVVYEPVRKVDPVPAFALYSTLSRHLGVLCVSVVRVMLKGVHRRDADNAEVAQRGQKNQDDDPSALC
jgi:hypothetical protein